LSVPEMFLLNTRLRNKNLTTATVHVSKSSNVRSNDITYFGK